ncbi:MAG: hypothetical protein R3E84_10780 [Pseudomonadales bacterium]
MRFSTSLPRFFDPVDRVPLRRSYRYAQLLEQLGFSPAMSAIIPSRRKPATRPHRSRICQQSPHRPKH